MTIAVDIKTGAVIGQVTLLDPPYAYGRQVVVLTSDGYRRIGLHTVRLVVTP